MFDHHDMCRHFDSLDPKYQLWRFDATHIKTPLKSTNSSIDTSSKHLWVYDHVIYKTGFQKTEKISKIHPKSLEKSAWRSFWSPPATTTSSSPPQSIGNSWRRGRASCGDPADGRCSPMGFFRGEGGISHGVYHGISWWHIWERGLSYGLTV